MFRRDQLRAFELTFCARIARKAEEIFVFEPAPHVKPTAVAGMIIDDPERPVEPIDGMAETAAHHKGMMRSGAITVGLRGRAR